MSVKAPPAPYHAIADKRALARHLQDDPEVAEHRYTNADSIARLMLWSREELDACHELYHAGEPGEGPARGRHV